MSQPAVPSGMAGFFLAIRDCGLHFVDAEIAERHFRSLLTRFGVTSKPKRGLAAGEAVDAF